MYSLHKKFKYLKFWSRYLQKPVTVIGFIYMLLFFLRHNKTRRVLDLQSRRICFHAFHDFQTQVIKFYYSFRKSGFLFYTFPQVFSQKKKKYPQRKKKFWRNIWIYHQATLEQVFPRYFRNRWIFRQQTTVICVKSPLLKAHHRLYARISVFKTFRRKLENGWGNDCP